MTLFPDAVIEAARKHALDCYPHEAVGLVIGDQYVPQENISQTPRETFEISPDVWTSGAEIQAVVHSHPDGGAYPSAIDMRHQIASGVPWGIVVCDWERAGEPVWFGDQVPRLPLTGAQRYFRHGVSDCYSLIRDYYRAKRDVILPDFPRDWDWWSTGVFDLYSDGFATAGFQRISAHEVLPGDVFLARLGRSPVPCHGGIYLGGSGDMILHHLCSGRPVDHSRLAVEEPGVRHLKYVTHWLRHDGGSR